MTIELNEIGKTYSKANGNKLVTAFKLLRSAIAEHLLSNEIEDDEETETKTKNQKEAATWSLSDLASALGRELREKTQNAYILDIYPEEAKIVYQVGWGGNYFECVYALDETGVATFGSAKEVSRKVTYVPTSDNDPEPEITMSTMESTTVELLGDQIELVERAVTDDGITMLKLISPGIGSSGYYSKEVLQRDGPKVFKKGLHNLIDHPTAQESAARPEGSIERVGSTLVEDAKWLDRYSDSKGTDHGAGLYAKAKVVPSFAEKLNVLAQDIGVSIRASGQARIGTVGGKQMPIVETIDAAKSVDYVTLPGRGGKVISLMESLNPQVEESIMAVTELEFKEVQETNRKLTEQVARLQEGQALSRAAIVVKDTLGTFPTLPRATRDRLQGSLPSQYTFNEAGVLDETALVETIKNAVAAEMAYLTSLGVGQVQGLGSGLTESRSIEDIEKELEADLAAL